MSDAERAKAYVEADPAKAIEEMLVKMDAQDKAAFNFCVNTAKVAHAAVCSAALRERLEHFAGLLTRKDGELDTLREEIARLRDAMLRETEAFHNTGGECGWCGDLWLTHTASCLIGKWRALLADPEGQRAGMSQEECAQLAEKMGQYGATGAEIAAAIRLK